MNYVRDALFITGVGLVATGAGFYDWRLACIAAGALLVAVTVLSYARSSH